MLANLSKYNSYWPATHLLFLEIGAKIKVGIRMWKWQVCNSAPNRKYIRWQKNVPSLKDAHLPFLPYLTEFLPEHILIAAYKLKNSLQSQTY